MVQILVIDDDPVIQMVLRHTLTNQGYEITLAKSGEEGLEKARQICPALIICDWLMPGVTGLEVCRRIRQIPELAKTFFIILTARSSIADRVEGLDSGADDFLSKPIEVNELTARVRAGLRLYQSSQILEKLAQDLQTQQKILEGELAEAADYVRSLLPPPLTTEAIAIDTCFLPSRELGGDCFDYYWLDDDHLVMYVLDVSGHGIGSALPSVSMQSLLRSHSLRGTNFAQPAEVLRSLNQIFQMDDHGNRYFTIWYGVYDVPQRRLTYASAGHPPALLLQHDPIQGYQVISLQTRSLPIGMMTEITFHSDAIDLPPSSTLYIFSDGAFEIHRDLDEIWGLENLADLLLAHHQTGDTGLPQMIKEIMEINGIQQFEDDLAMVQVRFT